MALTKMTQTYLALPEDMTKRLKEYRRTQPDLPDRAGIIREAIDYFLTAKGYPPEKA